MVFLRSLAKSKYSSLFSFSLIFTQWSTRMTNSIIWHVLFVVVVVVVVVNYHEVWYSGRNYVICQYLKIPKHFVGLIFLNKFWFVEIPFSNIIKFQFLAQFSVDLFPYHVFSSFCASFLLSLIMWLTAFFHVLWFSALTLLVLLCCD